MLFSYCWLSWWQKWNSEQWTYYNAYFSRLQSIKLFFKPIMTFCQWADASIRFVTCLVALMINVDYKKKKELLYVGPFLISTSKRRRIRFIPLLSNPNDERTVTTVIHGIFTGFNMHIHLHHLLIITHKRKKKHWTPTWMDLRALTAILIALCQSKPH